MLSVTMSKIKEKYGQKNKRIKIAEQKTLKILDRNMSKLYNELNKADVNVTKFIVIS